MTPKIDIVQLEEVVESVVGAKSLSVVLGSGKKLRVKLGVDPTRPDLHLGHAVVLEILRAFQDRGHETILVIGDFTARIGDPSDRKAARPPMSEEELKENVKTYVEQAKLILDTDKTKVIYNSTWLGKLTMEQLIMYASKLSLAQLIEREDFALRLKANTPVFLHELLYPLMQAIDSVELKADVELGGADQRLNLLIGRDLQRKFEQPPQVNITTKLMVGLDGKKKMSKSADNYIGLREEPDSIFGKVMSISDEMMLSFAQLGAWYTQEQIQEMKSAQPKQAKLELAKAIVTRLCSEQQATQAFDRFEKTFARKEDGSELATDFPLNEDDLTAAQLVAKLTDSSISEASRLVSQGGFKINGEKFSDPRQEVVVADGSLVQLGKKRFFRLVVK